MREADKTRPVDSLARAYRAARKLLAAYRRDLSPLRAARTMDDVRRFAAAHPECCDPSTGFNGDLLRVRIVWDLFARVGCSAFVETGSYVGSTALLAARSLRCPVFSCESDSLYWAVAKLRCAPLRRITVRRADSRTFLRGLSTALPLGTVPFVYLDAHWYPDLPLAEEMEIVASQWKRAVVLMDDVRVPGREDFGYDTYDGRPLDTGLVPTLSASRLPADSVLLFPDYDATQEVGLRRGYAVVGLGVRSVLGDRRDFPLSLLREAADEELDRR